MLNLVYTVQADLYALIVLSIIFINLRNKADLTNFSNQIFLLQVKLNAVALLLDLLMVYLDGSPGETVHLVLLISSVLYYCLNPLACLLWLIYADYFIYLDTSRLKRYALPIAIPTLALAFISILSLWGGYVFHISSDNIYRRGPYFLALPICCSLYILWTVLLICLNHKRIRSDDLVPLLLCAAPPLIAAYLQAMLYGVALLWPALTISLLLIFVYIQSTLMNTDHLTTLFNRREFDSYIDSFKRRRIRKKYTAGIMLDLNHFKHINDLYGHSSGDDALIYMSKILRHTFRHNDFIARIGGDEFAAILEVEEEIELNNLITQLKNNISAFNATGKAPYRLSISIGFGIFIPEEDHTLKEFFHKLDTYMYKDKRRNSSNLR